MISPEMIAQQISHVLRGTDFANLGLRYEGKVRDNYTQNGRRILVTTDRLSAFDRIIACIPFKGQVLNAMTKYWFEQTKDIAPNYVESYPDPNVMVGAECKPLMVEMIIRGYITGSTTTSAWYNYGKGVRNLCGNILPEGLKKNEKLAEPIITPTSKAAHGDHDSNMSPDQVIAAGLVTKEEWDQLADWTRKLYARGVELASARGMILVDTKFEFGRAPDGRLMLIDEILTPDSSRYWIADSYEARMAAGQEPENINKEYLRLWLAEQGYRGEGEIPAIPEEVIVETARRYIDAYERLTGTEFKPEVGDPLPRITEHLKSYTL